MQVNIILTRMADEHVGTLLGTRIENRLNGGICLKAQGADMALRW